MTAADTSLQTSGAMLGQGPDATLALGLLLGLTLTTGLLGLTKGFAHGRRRLLPVSGLAAALGIALGVAHAPGGIAASFLMSLLPGGALLVLGRPLGLGTHFPRLEHLRLPIIGVTWAVAAGSVLMPGRMPSLALWAQALLVLALPPLAIASLRAMDRHEGGASGLLLAVAGLAAAAMAPFFAAHGFDITAVGMAAVVLGLYLGIGARLEAEAVQQQAAATREQLASQAARLHDEHARFFSFIAHELRSPLGVLLVGLNNLRRAMPDAESAARIGRVNNAAQRMSALIDRHACLLSLVRSDFEPARSEHSPEQPALEALHALQHANPDRLFAHAGPDHALRPVSIDVELVTLALSNLLENAVKYAGENSPIRLETEVDADAVSYRVINDGPPLPPEVADQSYPILLPMKDANGTRSGFGIGLALAARVASVHGGQLTGQSAGGQTTFTLTLPCRPPRAARMEE